jgi:hypothetical protein
MRKMMKPASRIMPDASKPILLGGDPYTIITVANIGGKCSTKRGMLEEGECVQLLYVNIEKQDLVDLLQEIRENPDEHVLHIEQQGGYRMDEWVDAWLEGKPGPEVR